MRVLFFFLLRGSTLDMAYILPHFMRYRFGLIYYASKEAGEYTD